MKSIKAGLSSRRQNVWGWILITPLTLGLLIWVVFPMGLSFVTSLASRDMISPQEFVGLKNYFNLFSGDKLFLQAVVVTLWYTVLSVPLQLLEAARIDGATSRETFMHVTIPFMSPIILYNMIINMTNRSSSSRSRIS